MTHITDWIMIAITVVYVIATIFICHANYKSADASKKQLEEMKRQYDEKDRPFIDTELVYLNKLIYATRFVNHGYYSAKRVKVEFDDSFINSLPESTIKTLLKEQKDRECIIGAGQHYDLYIGDNNLRKSEVQPIKGNITYEANGKKYSSELFIDINSYMTFFSTDTELETIANAIDGIPKEIRKVADSIKTYNKQ